MTTPTHPDLATVAQVLIEHPSIPAYPDDASTPTSYRCPACPDIVIYGPNSPTHARHQAEALADAGLLRPDAVHHGDLGGLSRVEITSSLGRPPYVRIERGGVPLVDGYVTPDPHAPGPKIDAQAPRGDANTPRTRQDTRAPLEDRLRALANDMRAESPFTAGILWQFADDAAQLRAAGPVYTLDEISDDIAADVARYAERERRVRALAETLDGEASELDAAGGKHDAALTKNIVRLLRVALDGRVTTTPEGQ